MIYSPNGLMRYNDSVAIVDDMPLLSQWIKKHSFKRTSVFLAPLVGLEPTTCGLTEHETPPKKAR